MVKGIHRTLATILSIAILVPGTPATALADTVTDSVTPTCDEAFYAKMDYYGNLTESSVVKSYTLNGAKSITDYGTYDSVDNLTDSTEAVKGNGTTTFTFGDDAPASFYFEGKTSQPFDTLPWKISMSYTLNGVPKKAEELAGEKGVVEITINAVPNKSASEYMQNNYTLEAVAAFNQDDILSLEAPDAQLQTLGNIRVAMFIVLPGEEQHYTLRVGTDDFKFDGLTFAMGPINSGRLSKITDLKKDKEDVEDSYNDFNDALDDVLDSVDNMKGSLNDAATGLDDLNKVRGSVHSDKDKFYSDFDAFLNGLSDVSLELNPVKGHISAANNVLTDSRQNLSDLNDCLIKTRDDLKDAEDTITDLQSATVHTQDAVDTLQNESSRLKGDINSLNSLAAGSNSYIKTQIPTILTQMGQLYQLWNAYYGKATPSNATSIKSKGIIATSSDGLEDGEVYYDLEGSAVWTTDNSSGYKTFAQFATEVLMSKGATSDQAALYLAIWEHKDTLQSGLTSTAGLSNNVNNLLTNLADLSDNELYDVIFELTDDADKALGDTYNFSEDAQKAISRLDELHTTIDGYIPEAQSALSDASALTDSIQKTVDTLGNFMRFAESVMKKNSDALNKGTDETLRGAADILRKTSDTFDSTDKMRTAKDTIKNLIDDKWDKYTGEDSNILKMDPDAAPESLTSAENTNIKSVSVLIRTQEIKTEDSKSTTEAPVTTQKKGFWDRVAQMFIDIWHFLTGWIK